MAAAVCVRTCVHVHVCANTTQNLSWTVTGLGSDYNKDYKLTKQAVIRSLASIF